MAVRFHHCSKGLPIAVLTAAGVVFACSCRKADDKPPGYGRFDIKFPKGWELLRDFAGSKVLARAPAHADSKSFRASINVFEVAVSESMTALAYLEAVQSQMKDDLKDMKILSNGRAEVGGRDAQWTEYSYRLGGETVRARLYVLIATGSAYGVTLSASLEDFDAHAAEFDNALKSFALIE